jgi:hypothetical protein
MERISEKDRVGVSSDGKAWLGQKNGWYYAELSGGPAEIGVQHGELLASTIKQAIEETKSLVYLETGMDWLFFKKQADSMWVQPGKITPAVLEELNGIAEGVNKTLGANTVDLLDVIVWNGYEELTDYWFPTVAAQVYADMSHKVASMRSFSHGARDRCSAFIATGAYTADGQIVAAHNSFTPFESGNYCNVILKIHADSGIPFKMQSQPGYVHSMSDFYVTGSNLVITETTIGGFCAYDEKGVPEFVRIRNAVQQSSDKNSVIAQLRAGNNGGYANTWLIGDYNKNEITRFEQGLNFDKEDSLTGDGYFVGFNAPLDPRIRNLECTNSGFADIRRHQGARQVRLPQLMEQHKGLIDAETAKLIISDHYDVYTGQETDGNSRTVCSHYELDKREYMSQADRPFPYQPRGAVDGIVCSADYARNLEMAARFGSSCGRPFYTAEFLKEHPQFEHLRPFLKDRPAQSWTIF